MMDVNSKSLRLILFPFAVFGIYFLLNAVIGEQIVSIGVVVGCIIIFYISYFANRRTKRKQVESGKCQASLTKSPGDTPNR